MAQSSLEVNVAASEGGDIRRSPSLKSLMTSSAAPLRKRPPQKAAATKQRRRLDVEEGLVDVSDDVVDVFDADGEAHEAVGDADALAHFLGHGGMGHLRG